MFRFDRSPSSFSRALDPNHSQVGANPRIVLPGQSKRAASTAEIKSRRTPPADPTDAERQSLDEFEARPLKSTPSNDLTTRVRLQLQIAIDAERALVNKFGFSSNPNRLRGHQLDAKKTTLRTLCQALFDGPVPAPALFNHPSSLARILSKVDSTLSELFGDRYSQINKPGWLKNCNNTEPPRP